ncbi:mRNA capping enzyme, alpha subunit [Didymella exigua CBS 183.55]|uniref:mRNA-capping enzyme subunit alpha n=1 Tax=Didymella exigua CBS 183.55 TaxID=1150837 RepID=A0A6A5RPF1_9PLEO|nr:mRNA capping enzyme, alpha subunit [Didymella exigua CBS 183.55]KAF1927387.1 mRNA capping enzyme, alpha subunit [Didymella exigua CBS 183.55]
MPSSVPVHAPPPQMPGNLVPNEDARGLKEDVAALLERDRMGFPGAQPVSFGRDHLAELQKREYFMCEKTDGLRVLLFMHWFDNGSGPRPLTFLIDRKNNFYNIDPPIRVPYWQDPNDREKFLFGTILDGELVNDQYPGEPAPRLIYYVFDALVVDAQNVTQKGMDKRLGRMKEHVLKPYNKWLEQNPSLNVSHMHPFRIKEKMMHQSYHLQHVFSSILPTLKHGNDGLIFTCKDTRYQFGTDQHILKWKPPHENTIDFKLRLGEFPLIDPEDGEESPVPDYDALPSPVELHVQHNNNDYRTFARLDLTPEEWKILKSLNQRLDGRIIECYRATNGQWKYKAEADGTPRWRDDKKDANHISTVKSVIASIENPVTELDLLGYEQKIKEAVYRIQGRPLPAQSGEEEREAKKRKYSEANGQQ